MAPIKFEEQIKQKLEAREIKPSQNSWNDLNGKLDNDRKVYKKPFWFLGIAASILGIFLITSMFFNAENDERSLPTIVDTQRNESDLNKETPSKTNNLEDEVKDLTIGAIENNETLVEHETINSTKGNLRINPKFKVSEDNESKTLAKTLNKSEHLENENKGRTVESANKLTKIDLKVSEVVAQIRELEHRDGKVTEREIDSLLKQAEKDILKQRVLMFSTRTVDAKLLLQDVEEELEESFRVKVFDALKSSYEKVKTAVADRNN